MNLAAIIPAIAGALLSLAFQVIPGLNEWYEEKDSKVKSLIMLGTIVVSAAILFFLSCYSPWIYVQCNQEGFWELMGGLATVISMTFIGNQAAYNMVKHFGNGSNN